MSVTWLSKPDIIKTIPTKIIHTNSVLDIGCGIHPISYFKPKVHVAIEPYIEYINALKIRRPDINIIEGTAQTILPMCEIKSFDSIFMIDVIEHIPKSDGILVINECERITRQQIVIYTPLGFAEQKYKPNEKDAWGMYGTKWQTHISGWNPEDFDQSWDLYICEKFHFKSNGIFGAIWAIKNI